MHILLYVVTHTDISQEGKSLYLSSKSFLIALQQVSVLLI